MNLYYRYFLAFLGLLITNTTFSQSDDPCGAPALTVNSGSCSFTTGSNATATASSGVPAPGCASYSGGDVWYTITVPASGNVDINTNTGVITDGGMAVYSGTCGSLTLVECDDDDSPNGLMPFISLTGQTPGATLWIRVWEYGNNNNGTFDICAEDPVVLPPPANDECATATSAPVNPDLNCGSTVSGTIQSATASSQANGCGGTADDDVWYSFVATSTAHTIDLTNVTGSTTDLYHSVYSGTCGSLGTALVCSDPNSSSVGGLIPGNTYYVRVYSWTSTTGQTTTFDLCIGTPPPPPANDECANATPATVNPDNLCGSVTPGTIASATTSAQANGCGGTADDDVWFSFVATNTSHYIDLLNITGSTTDLYHSVYSGACGSLGTALVCSDPNSSTLTGLTPGNTYYVRVYSWTSTTGQTSSFDLCIGTPPPPPANDDCNNAITAPVTPLGSGCINTTGTIASATASSQTNGCSGTADDDVWYEFTATSTAVNISLSNITGSTTDLYHSVYQSNCGSLGTAIVCSDPNTSSVTGLTIGQTYLVRIFSWTSTAGQTSTFDLCIQETGPCGTPSNQDYCNAPAILTQGAGTFSSNTSGTYSSDTPANLTSLFCGSIENNSWYEFVASGTTETFNFSSVTGCSSGIQAEVYEVAEDVNGCCTNFTSMSNCWNPATATSGTVTATGLTPGNNYILMVDGFGGDVCDFTVTGWTAVGILPIELISFNGVTLSSTNSLKWSTASERDNDHFNILRSFDGINFEKIGEQKGAGTTISESHYEFIDTDIRTGDVYYQLEQVDYNGTATSSEIISLQRDAKFSGVVTAYPNPTNSNLTIEVQSNKKGELLILTDLNGSTLIKKELDGSFQKIDLDLSQYASGLYLLQYKGFNGRQSVTKITKN